MKINYLGRFVGGMLAAAFFNLFVPPIEANVPQKIETPEQHFGFKPGTDRMLFNYESLISYLKKLDASSPRLKLVEIGESPMGRKMYIAFISSENNIANLDNLKLINRRLALDPNIPDSEKESILKNGKVFFLATLSMHSTEVGPSQAAPLIAYKLVTTEDPQILGWLNNVVYMMVPCHNPDGMDMVVAHYNKYKGTKYEGCSMPGVYHKYVGHDNNRDFVNLTQKDTKVISKIYDKEWFPQVMVEKHQMGSTGTRYFVPPFHDPISENVDAGIWNWMGIFGSNLVKDMTEKGLAGVSQHYLFDDYWPGSTETCIWKGVIGFLTECASAKLATPVFVEPNELRVSGKGLSEYKKSVNMPLPWSGGWWRLSDIMKYELASTMSIIKTASLHRREILEFRNEICRKEVLKGKTRPPYYYVMPLEQHDESELVTLVNLLKEHGITVYRLSKSGSVDNMDFQSGDIVVPLAQSFRSFIKEVMEKQEFPVRHYTPSGEIIRPYDVTSWSLPLNRGVKVIEVDRRSVEFESLLEEIKGDFSLKKQIPDNYWAAFFTVNNNESFKAAFAGLRRDFRVDRLLNNIQINNVNLPKGSFIIYNNANNKIGLRQIVAKLKVSPLFVKQKVKLEATPVKMPRIALIETYFHDMDAGWTRFIFDSYYIPYTVVHPGDFEKTDFTKNFDVVIFPDANKSILMSGKYKSDGEYYVSSYPPEYTKGIGKKGMEKLMTFLDKGGIIISWGRSTGLFLKTLEINHGKNKKEEFQLPIRDISKQLRKSGLYCPGSIMEVNFLKDYPLLTFGMEEKVGVFFRGGPVFRTSIPNFDMDRRVIAVFPEKDILLSGYCEHEEKLANQTPLVWLRKGKGQFVLFGFNPQFRGSTCVTFKLLFNALLLPKIY